MGASLSARALADRHNVQRGRVAIVTGANTGIGKQTALALAQCGHTVIMAGRSEQRCKEAADSIRAVLALHEQGPSKPLMAFEPDLRCMLLDLSDLHSVKAFAEAFLAMNLPLHLLVNNAGISMTDFGTTAQGLEQQWGCVSYVD